MLLLGTYLGSAIQIKNKNDELENDNEYDEVDTSAYYKKEGSEKE